MRAQHLTKRVANEVEIHWQLRHSAILELFNYFEDSDYVYLIMELCENGNLFQHLKEKQGKTDMQSYLLTDRPKFRQSYTSKKPTNKWQKDRWTD